MGADRFGSRALRGRAHPRPGATRGARPGRRAHSWWSRSCGSGCAPAPAGRPAGAEGAAPGRDPGPRSTSSSRRSGNTPTLSVNDAFDGGRRAARLLLAPLHAGEEARAAYRFPTDRRGRFEVGPLRVTVDRSVRSRAALASSCSAPSRSSSTRACATCSRRPRPAASISTASSRRSRSRIEPSGEFHTLRDYAPGDDLRHVHWKSTARRGHLMMRQNEARRRTPVLVVLDVRPARTTGVSFERAVEACASIVTAIDRSGPAGRGDPRHRRRRSARPVAAISGSVMDELAVVEPHGPERLVAAESRPADRLAGRHRRSRATHRRHRARGARSRRRPAQRRRVRAGSRRISRCGRGVCGGRWWS